MKAVSCIFLAVLLLAKDAAPACENTWTSYKNNICIKAFANLETYDDAKAFCASQGDSVTPTSLVMVKDADMQSFLSNYTEGFFDYIWLGGRYEVSSSQFKWEDGSPLNYTNWMDGYPRNNTNEDSCIELRPMEDAKNSVNDHGKWAHDSCRKRNLVMCQKSVSWSLEDAVREIISLRQQHEQEVTHLENKIQALTEEVSSTMDRVVPPGSIYVQYYNQPSPRKLWPDPNVLWLDITPTYQGLFFRAEGPEAPEWGSIQEACAPRVTGMEHEEVFEATGDSSVYPNPVDLAVSGWSGYGHTGSNSLGLGARNIEALRFYTEDCEVRPRNQAVKIWKRY